ncbi:flagellar motor switch protein FliN/FliY [Nitrosomonas marina]|uniref:Flagellar motor switch protein FliN n=1 Tax=Nitrosomonas marina TaxID=917 RepID=A0A1H9Y804_9PROT|nr:flagellar motor switch protein FliN [Nitrosomonas marina]SES65066.1 flagellar motor switch protein FliN/FliY [Nitrosomonas marina]
MTDTSVQQNELDSWAEAMAEQEAATQNTDANSAGTASNHEPTPECDTKLAKNQSAEPDRQTTAFREPKNTNNSIFKEFSNDGVLSNTSNDIDLILDIPVQLTVELGRTKIAIKNLLQLAQGSVVELDGLAGEPMDVLVNGCLIAQGEVVVVNDKFGIRLTDIITPSERIRKLNR